MKEMKEKIAAPLIRREERHLLSTHTRASSFARGSGIGREQEQLLQPPAIFERREMGRSWMPGDYSFIPSCARLIRSAQLCAPWEEGYAHRRGRDNSRLSYRLLTHSYFSSLLFPVLWAVGQGR